MLGFDCPFLCYFAFFWSSRCNILTVVVHLFSTHKRSFPLVFEGDFDCFCSDPIESPFLSCQMSLIGGEPCVQSMVEAFFHALMVLFSIYIFGN